MSFAGFLFKTLAAKGDAKRDSTLTEPQDVTAVKNIDYVGKQDFYNLLDVYYPQGTKEKLPVIVSVHGGGYVYGTKEIYKFYGMYLAQQGFVFVNFNYHLAPKAKFPSQLGEINQVAEWIVKNADTYHMDVDNIFMVGDSAGAQMASQYAAICSNPGYAGLFAFQVPKEFHLRAVGLNCGMYEIGLPKPGEKKKGMESMTGSLMRDYLGKNDSHLKEMLDVKGHITGDYPPAYLMTSYYDFLKDKAEPMYRFLKEKGVDAEYKCYGTAETQYMQHVCHVNMNLQEAKEINDDECAFFKKHMASGACGE